jgi:type IV secretory pathway VirB2 component (pilin)
MAAGADIGTKYLSEIETELPGQTEGDLWKFIGQIIDIVLGVLGVLLVILIIYAGFLWMTSQGDKDKVTKAKGIIMQAVIGLVIIFAAYALANFVLSALNEAI